MPIRIQKKRTRGWKMPENTVYVGRPSKWGNPLMLQGDQIYIDASYRRPSIKWVCLTIGDINDLILIYRKLWDGTVFQNPDLQRWSDIFKTLDLNELRGKNLCCWCPHEPCHAAELLKLANK